MTPAIFALVLVAIFTIFVIIGAVGMYLTGTVENRYGYMFMLAGVGLVFSMLARIIIWLLVVLG